MCQKCPFTAIFVIIRVEAVMNIIHIKEPNRKTYSLQFDHQGRLLVKTDIKFFGNKLDEILKKHSRWIKQNFKKAREQVSIIRQDFLKEGYEFSILGETYKLKYKIVDSEYFSIEMDNGKLLITQPKKGKLNKAQVKKELISFFKEVARDHLSKRTSILAEKMNLRYKRIFIKNQKTKWGSCSSESNLNYNWHLIFVPKEVVDYVIIHELAHLKHMNHSKYFWNLVEKYDTHYRARVKWLKENEHVVRIFN